MSEKLSVNPWLGMWVRPRETIRAILSYNKNYLLFLLYWIYGFPLSLQFAQNFSLGDRFSLGAIIGAAAIGGIFLGFIGITIGSWLFYKTGRWIGGTGSFQDVRAAVAWSSVPNIVGIAVWAVQVAMFGKNIFSVLFFSMPLVGMELSVTYICSIVSIALMIWGLVILLKAIGEAQRFSAWKALLNVFLPFIVIFIGLKLLVWLYMLLTSAVH
jgi:hypothetical protein